MPHGDGIAAATSGPGGGSPALVPVDVAEAELLERLERLARRRRPVIVEIAPGWCVFSLLLGPRIAALCARHGREAEFLRVDLSRGSPVSTALRLRCVPATMLVMGGELRRCWYGGDPPLAQLERALARAAEGSRDDR